MDSVPQHLLMYVSVNDRLLDAYMELYCLFDLLNIYLRIKAFFSTTLKLWKW